jgi:hypothetical protein
VPQTNRDHIQESLYTCHTKHRTLQLGLDTFPGDSVVQRDLNERSVFTRRKNERESMCILIIHTQSKSVSSNRKSTMTSQDGLRSPRRILGSPHVRSKQKQYRKVDFYLPIHVVVFSVDSIVSVEWCEVVVDLSAF